MGIDVHVSARRASPTITSSVSNIGFTRVQTADRHRHHGDDHRGERQIEPEKVVVEIGISPACASMKFFGVAISSGAEPDSPACHVQVDPDSRPRRRGGSRSAGACGRETAGRSARR